MINTRQFIVLYHSHLNDNIKKVNLLLIKITNTKVALCIDIVFNFSLSIVITN